MKISCANRLKERMQELNIKQIDLCQKTGISQSTMSQYLNGKYEPNQHRIFQLAKLLDVSEGWLMGLEIEKTRQPLPSKEDLLLRQIVNSFRALNEQNREELAKYANNLLKIESFDKTFGDEKIKEIINRL